MIYVLRSPECNGICKSQLLKAINTGRIYKDFRWNFINKQLLPTIKNKFNQPIRDAIIQLNENKDEIIETFTTKNNLAQHLGVSTHTIRKMIQNQDKYNSFYYIEYKKCPIELIEKYNKPIFGTTFVQSKKIKQIYLE
jgi:hypothetical protein